MNQYSNGEELKQKVIRDQVSQVEQRIKNLQRSMNAELDSLLSQLQHLKDLTAEPEAPNRSDTLKVQQVKLGPDTWEHIPDVLKVKDVQDILKIGRDQAYDLVNSKVFHHVRIGRLIMIPKPGFIAWLEGGKQ